MNLREDALYFVFVPTTVHGAPRSVECVDRGYRALGLRRHKERTAALPIFLVRYQEDAAQAVAQQVRSATGPPERLLL